MIYQKIIECYFISGVVALVLAIAIFSTVHYLPHYTMKLLEYFIHTQDEEINNQC